jgi:signal transduction histidine kinase
VKAKSLPAGSVVVNKPDSVLDKYAPQIVAIIVFIVLQTMLVLVLINNMRLRRRAIEELERERLSLEERVQARTAELVGAKALAAFAKEQDRAIEAERRRLAREVHDQIGQVFTAIKLIINSLPRQAYPPGQENALAQALDMGIASTRRITSELRPPLLDDLGLAAAVNHYVKSHPGLVGINCSVAIAGESALDAQRSLALFRIIQEAVTNVVRHARAANLSIDGVADSQYILKIVDDGCGLDQSTIRPGALGVVGMRERVNMLGGEFTISSHPGDGVVIEVRLPLSTAQP